MMVRPIAILLICQLIGEAIARLFALPVPGPVVGLVLLVVWLLLAVLRNMDIESDAVTKTADGFLAMLGLLFVPAGVGVVQQTGVLGAHGWALIVTIAGSTLITLAVTVGTFLLVKRLTARPIP